MASSYSTSLRLELPADGEKTGTWGQIVNTNLGTLIEQAIAGAVDISVTAGDVTLTTANGSTDEARHALLNVTGSPGTTRVITCPAQEKIYWVRNASDSTVTIKAPATTGVNVAAGATGAVAFVGTDFISLYVATSGTFGAGSVSAPSITVTGDTNTGVYFPSADNAAVTTGGVQRALFNSSGTTANNLVVNGHYVTTKTASGSGSGTRSYDATTTNYVEATAGGVTTWAITSVPAGVYVFVLELTNGGAYAQTWMSGTKWPSGTAPTLTTSGTDVLVFITDDAGTTWRGMMSQRDSR